ncbi:MULTISPECIES: DUF3800 domain-containing protein [Bacillus]|uniref:DUF3800 domain-containing protein n=1 Tax=Bacillus TaxID=1386 RepID=UPI000BFC5039|nr:MULTISPECIES: DUF3800 domain-containing protein [Bacillus]MCR6850060.1 DUF3800 domain-containing protein [Bacillus sp. IBL03825]PGK38691.1 hypothetical protein CN908_17145 [Bacillus thuringiensis]
MDFLSSKEREEAILAYKSLDPNLDFEVDYNFYYDETNNCRKLSIREGKLNFDKNKDFVLGGVVLEKHNTKDIEDSFDFLKKKLKVQSNLKEIKFKNICPKGSDFLKCIHNRKVHDFIEWLLENDIYIHFSMLDHLYYSLVDIIDSLGVNYWEGNNLKTALYQFVYYNTENFMEILDKYNYPNVGANLSPAFYDVIINCIKPLKPIKIPGSSGLQQKINLIEAFRDGRKKEPIFLINNEDKILIKEYYIMYARSVYMFKNAFHLFDEESSVQNEIKKTGIKLDQVELKNYEFIRSDSNIFIQLSDIIMGIIGKLFEFIKKFPIDNIKNANISFDEHHQKGFNLLKALLHKSYQKNGAFRNMSANQELQYKFDIIMGFK